jgi:hypothetical protein
VIERDQQRLVAEDMDFSLADLSVGGVPATVIGRLNKNVGERIVRRVAARRARASVGRLLPLGIGVAIAAGADYMALRSAGNAGVKYLDWLENEEGSRASLTAA